MSGRIILGGFVVTVVVSTLMAWLAERFHWVNWEVGALTFTLEASASSTMVRFGAVECDRAVDRVLDDRRALGSISRTVAIFTRTVPSAPSANRGGRAGKRAFPYYYPRG